MEANDAEHVYDYSNSYSYKVNHYVYSTAIKSLSLVYSEQKYPIVTSSQEGDLKKYSIIDNRGENPYDVLVYSGKDSLYITSGFATTRVTEYIRNDTLFRTSINGTTQEKTITVGSGTQCRTARTEYSNTVYNTDSLQYTKTTFKIQGDTIITSTPWTDASQLVKYYIPYSKLKKTMIIHNSRPAMVPQKGKAFDLLGRPAKDKHSINIFK